MAVTGPDGRVHGIGGLRVAIFGISAVPRANTNIPTIMTAEKIADSVLSTRLADAGEVTKSRRLARCCFVSACTFRRLSLFGWLVGKDEFAGRRRVRI